MTYFSIALMQFLIISDMLRRLSAVSAAILCSFYIIIMQLFFVYRATTFSGVNFAVGSAGSFYHRTEAGVMLYSAILILIYVSTLGVHSQKTAGLRQMFMSDLRIPRMLTPIAVFVATITFLRVISLDMNILWNNDRYLLIASVDGLAINNSLFSFIRSISGIAMVIAGAFFACAILLRSWGAALLLGICLLVLMVISVAGAFRTAAIPAAAVAVPLFLFGELRHKVLSIAFVCLSFTLIIVALVGRGMDAFGISNIPMYFAELFSYDASTLITAATLNISQGIFVTTDSIYIGGDFNVMYKVLSFSPFPSFIDGFEEARSLYQIRLHRFVPMSAIGEVYNFGLPWIVGFSLFMMALFRANVKIDPSRYPFIFITSSIIIFLFFMMANGYPMRNVFRQFLIAYALVYWPTVWSMARRPLAATWPKPDVAPQNSTS